jgi:hypothetical protein
MKLICNICDSEIINCIYCKNCDYSTNSLIIDVYINDVKKYYYNFIAENFPIYIYNSYNGELITIFIPVDFNQLKSYIENLIFL